MDDHAGLGAPRDEGSFAANDVRRTSTPGPFGRSNPDPGPEYRRDVTPDIKAGIVGSLRRAYSIVHEAHDDALGFDAHTFGYNVYRVGLHWLRKYCEASGGKLIAVSSLRLRHCATDRQTDTTIRGPRRVLRLAGGPRGAHRG